MGGRNQGQETTPQSPQAAPKDFEAVKARIAELEAKLSTGAKAPRPPGIPESLKNQKVEVRDRQSGGWKPGTVAADIRMNTADGPLRRLRGTFDDGGKFNNVDYADVRKPEAKPSLGVDFDGTLFKENPDGSIGAPIPERIASLKEDIAKGAKPIIESRRAGHPGEIENIHKALESVGLPRLPVTAKKNAAGELIGDKEKQQAGVTLEKVPTNANTPLPKLAEPEHPALSLGEHAEHTEMLPTQVVAKYRNSHVEMVPTKELEKYREQDRSVEPRGEKGYLDQLKAELDRDGLKEPLVLKYGSEDKKAHLWDGNHRLNWALDKGVKELPVMVITGKKTDNGYGVSVPGHKGESVPVALKPSEIGLEGRAVKKEGEKYKFGNTQANIPATSEAAKAIETARNRISDSDLAGKGKDIGDGGNHVTVRYGIKGDDTEGIKKFLTSQAPFEATLGKTEKFPPSEHSDGAAVIVAPIEAKDLHRLNSELEKHGEFSEPSFKEYKPHATIAYVDPAKADRYVGMDVTKGKTFTVDSVAITKKDGSQEIVKFGGSNVEAKPQATAGVRPVSQAAETSTKKAAEDKLGFKAAFGPESLRNAATASFIDSAWKRLSVGKRMVVPGALENRIQSAADARKIKSREDVAKIVSDWAENRNKPAESKSPVAEKNKAESILSGETGTFEPGKLTDVVSEAAGTMGNYVREATRATELARQLGRSLQTLDTAAQADILRAKQTFEDLKKLGLTNADDSAIYHNLEDPKSDLTKGQEQFKENVAQPLADLNEKLFTELTEGGVPVENYISRSVKGKGGMLDRIASGVKGVAKKGTLSKAAPQTKHRSMMAIESPEGERRVVSIKDGKATMWQNGESSELGEIKVAGGKGQQENETWPDGEPNSAFFDKGKVVEGPDGYDWKITQATTKEIEANTDLEYYHSAFASLLSSNIQLGRAVRAMRFLNDFKESPEFKEISWTGSGSPPRGWKATILPQFKGIYFEPRTAEVLDEYADRLKGGDFGVLQTIQSFLRAAYLINPIVHPLNVAASWSMEKGVSGLMPWKWKRVYDTGTKAVKAVLQQNQDFQDALDAGGALQSHRAAIQDMHKLFFDRIAEGLDKKETWAHRIAEALGIEKGNLLNLLHKPSSIAAWTSSDIMYLQAAYQYQAEHPGATLADSLEEVGRIIPEYRVPTRIMDSRLLSKAMTNPIISWFGAYHYSLLHSFGQAAKSALGAQEPTQGRTKAEEVAKGWDRLALLGLVTMALFPYVFDKAAKKATGDEHARMRRPGPFGIVDAAEQVEEGKQSAGAAAQKVFTPSPITKGTAELLSDRELFSGRQIYDPHANWKTQGEQVGRYLMGNLGGQYGQYTRTQTADQKRRFILQQAGVQFGKTRAEKTAQDIAVAKVGTEAESPEDQANRVQRREILDQMRKGNRQPFEEARSNKELTHRQILDMERRAKLTPLEDTVHNFSVAETQRVLDAARADKNKAEIEELQRILQRKRMRARMYYQGTPAVQ